MNLSLPVPQVQRLPCKYVLVPGNCGNSPWFVAEKTAVLHISNSGTDALNWTASTAASWLTLSKSDGLSPDTLTVTADPGTLGDGDTRQASITITGYDAENNVVGTASIPVTLSAGGVWFNTFAEENIYLPMVIKP